MSKIKKIAVLIIALLIAVIVVSFVVCSVINLIVPPKYASYSDEIVEDIGGDGVLTATLKSSYKLSEENIPDDGFDTSLGSYHWVNAKNITYLDSAGMKDYMIVWKAPASIYNEFSGDEVMYISDSLEEGNCFILYNPDTHMAYGIIVDTQNITHSEYDLMYNILNLSESDYSLLHTSYTSSYSTGGYSSGDHYHTVVPDRYTLSRTDPGAYYDHYEYGDNYDIDSYLESEGYD